MTFDDGSRTSNRFEKFAVLLFTGFTAAIVLPALVFIVISIVSPGSIDLGH